jgi:hypothetical protein
VVVLESSTRVVAQWACGASAWWAGRWWPGWPVGGALVDQKTVIWLDRGDLGRPAGGWQPTCSFSVSLCGEAFHKLGVQGAEVSALPGALPQSSVSPASQQGP